MKRLAFSSERIFRFLSPYVLVLLAVSLALPMVGFGQEDTSKVIRLFPSNTENRPSKLALTFKRSGQSSNLVEINVNSLKVPFQTKSGEVWFALKLFGKNLGQYPDYQGIITHIYRDGRQQHSMLLPFTEGEPGPHAWQSNLTALTAGMDRVQARFIWDAGTLKKTDISLDSAHAFFFFPDPDFQPSPPAAWVMKDACGCPLPQHVTRSGWGCPDGQNPSCANPAQTVVTHLVVHHSATPNSSANWANVVRSIWNYHTMNNGWCDIGYNWLIDPNGVIYEGRGGGDNIRGAHFCGTNSGTMGICMLGDYRVDTPSTAALRSLERLLAWKSCRENLLPTDTSRHAASGRDLPNIVGHRLGCNTTCPGDQLYNRLTLVRTHVEDTLAQCPRVTGKTPNAPVSLQVFPIPAREGVWLKVSDRVSKACLIDPGGRTVRSYPEGSHFFSTSGIPPGTYLLKIQSRERWYFKKVLLQ